MPHRGAIECTLWPASSKTVFSLAVQYTVPCDLFFSKATTLTSVWDAILGETKFYHLLEEIKIYHNRSDLRTWKPYSDKYCIIDPDNFIYSNTKIIDNILSWFFSFEHLHVKKPTGLRNWRYQEMKNLILD